MSTRTYDNEYDVLTQTSTTHLFFGGIHAETKKYIQIDKTNKTIKLTKALNNFFPNIYVLYTELLNKQEIQ